MIDKRGNVICPKCQSNLLAKQDKKIFCLCCDWSKEAERKEDLAEIPEIHTITALWD